VEVSELHDFFIYKQSIVIMINGLHPLEG